MLRGRIVAANGIKAEDLKVPPSATWVLQSDRGITYASEMPRRLAAGRRGMVGRRLPGPAAGLVREARSPTGSASSSATRSPSTCSAATSRREGRQPAQRRLAEPRHQLRAGVLARTLRRRAAYPHRDADLAGRRRHARAGNRAAQGGRATRSRTSPRCASRTRSTRSAASCATSCVGGARRELRGVGRGGAGARRRARRGPSPPDLRRGGAQDARRDARTPDRRLRARIPAARLRHGAVRRRGRFGRRVDGRHAR